MAAASTRRLSLWLLGVLVLAAPHAPAQAAPGRTAERATPLAQALGLLDPAQYKEELLWWTAEERAGREAGTQAADEVAARAAWQLAELGLKPLGDKVAGKPSFYQDFPLPSNQPRWVDPGKAHLRLAGKKLAMEADWALLGGPARVNVKDAALVFLGHGQDDRDLVDAGLEGKAAVMWEGERATADPAGRAAWIAGLKGQAKRAAAFGAVALLLAPAPGNGRPLHLQRQNLLGSRDQKIPVVQLSAEAAAGLLARLKATEGAEITAAGIPGAFLELSWEPTQERKGRNVAAFWPGSDPVLSKEYVVIGAHRDHVGVGYVPTGRARRGGEVHPGADDNASGSIGVLQLARAFATGGLRCKRSLIFLLFDAEEMGLVGSRHWVAHPPVPLEQVVAMLNLDMIGRASEEKCSVLGVESSPGWSKLLEDASTGSALSFQPMGGGFGGSDHMSFQMKGIPALFFFSGMHAQYHLPDDTAERCDCAAAVEILGVVVRLAVLLGDQPGRLEAGKPESTGRKGRLQLGVVPQQTPKGIEIRQVEPGSAAAEAGLEKGDLLVAVDGRTVKRISELYTVLRRKTKGETVALAWKRGAREMSGTGRLK